MTAVQVWHEDLEEKLKWLGFMPLGIDTGLLLQKMAASIPAIDTHADDSTGIYSSKEELNLKASIQKF